MARRETTSAASRAIGAQRFAPLRRWLITAAATVVSICALDSVAAASGGLLVASRLLADTRRGPLLAIVALSYAVWGWGLRLNLRENWRLLVQTGTSTNLLSKLGYELARRRAPRPAVRSAAAAGYLITEVAKELPYYAAAFGTARYSASIDAGDAIAFIAGANLGAALYEFCVAGLSRTYLARRPPPFPADRVAAGKPAAGAA